MTGLDLVQHETELDEVLDFVQQHATVQAAGTGVRGMGATQAAWMTQQARAEAGGDATAEEVAQAHQESVAEQRAAWEARGRAAITSLVAHARSAHPELGFREDQFVLDFATTRADGSLAYTVGDGRCYLGEDAVECIEADPAFFVSVAVHELTGHREFDHGYSVSGFVYQQATDQLDGYTAPAEDSPEADAEWQRYQYFESEIGALLREAPYYVGENAAGTENPQWGPQGRLDAVLGQVVDQWAPELRVPMFGGLARRFEIDPRITDAAVTMYRQRVAAVIGVSS